MGEKDLLWISFFQLNCWNNYYRDDLSLEVYRICGLLYLEVKNIEVKIENEYLEARGK